MSEVNKYVIDDYGNKYTSMTKEEILQSIGAGGDRENVLTSCIVFNSSELDFSYTGSLPDSSVITKLLGFCIDPDNNNLTQNEISSYIGMETFALNFYYIDSEIYISNGTHEKLSFVQIGKRMIDLYPASKKVGYFIKSTEPINDIKTCTKQEFDDIKRQNEVFYVVTDEEYTQTVLIPVLYQEYSDGKTPTTTIVEFDSNLLDYQRKETYMVELYAYRAANNYIAEHMILQISSISHAGTNSYLFTNGNHNVTILQNDSSKEIKSVSYEYNFVANEATYASSDHTKGTIEERLTKLGFEEGSLTISSGSATFTSQSLRKQGKFALCSFYLNNGGKSENMVLQLPTGFYPKVKTKIGGSMFYADVNVDGTISLTLAALGYFQVYSVGWEIA